VRVEVAGVPYLVSPGAVSIEATALGYEPLKVQVNVSPGETKEVRLVLTSLPPCPGDAPRAADGNCPAPIAPSGPAAGLVVGTTASGVAPETSQAPAMRRVGMIVGIGGGVLLVGGAIAWLVADGKYGSVRDQCDQGCNAQSRSDGISSVQTWDRLAGVGLIGGGVLAVGGAAMFFLSPPADRQVAIAVDPRGTVVLKGRF
jgi:hypothetical protein